ncbi:MAG TPA: BtpA family membrane complex biogenesis protein, partial [Phycisphaerales bacterium]|nr:BtpA family membrane complex biogenesis protein [Phycisphaerales bacterium]
MANFRALFQKDKVLIGMVHLQALPGTPSNTLTAGQIVDIAVEEATTLARLGFD